MACSTDSFETHFAWTKSEHDENGLNNFPVPFPLLADHSQALTRKFDLLDSNQGSAKNALILMDAKGIIKHKEINDSKTAFSVDDALSILLTSKIPLFDKSVLEGSDTVVFFVTWFTIQNSVEQFSWSTFLQFFVIELMLPLKN